LPERLIVEIIINRRSTPTHIDPMIGDCAITDAISKILL